MNRRQFIRAASGLMVPAAYGQALSLADSAALQKPVAASGVTYLVEEDCEGTGTPSGWIDGSSPDWDYATSPAPLVDTQSLYLNGGDSTYYTFAGQDDVWAYIVFNMPTAAVNQGYFPMGFRGSTTSVARGYLLVSTMRPYVYAGTLDQAGTAGTVSAATTYHFWLHYIKGTGADSFVGLYWNTTSDFSGATSLTKSNGNATVQADNIYFANTSGNELVIDKIRVSATAIGSAPS